VATVLLFHHALGLTEGLHSFAGALSEAGHVVHCPDLYDGRTFTNVNAGVAHAESIGFENIMAAGVEFAKSLPGGLVYAGFSLGVLQAQKLAQTRPGGLGALLYHDVIPGEFLDSSWPTALPVQIHVSESDPWADHSAVQSLARDAEDCELFVYPGNAHLFADPSSPEYDADAAALLLNRTLVFLDRVG
jgi:dienelactone hydrolase